MGQQSPLPNVDNIDQTILIFDFWLNFFPSPRKDFYFDIFGSVEVDPSSTVVICGKIYLFFLLGPPISYFLYF